MNNVVLKFFAVALMLSTVSLPRLGFANSDCVNLLRPETREVLQRANRDDYKVVLLQKVIDGQTKLVALVGESHNKSAESAKLGTELGSHFEFYGFEGADKSLRWGTRLSKFLNSKLK